MRSRIEILQAALSVAVGGRVPLMRPPDMLIHADGAGNGHMLAERPADFRPGSSREPPPPGDTPLT